MKLRSTLLEATVETAFGVGFCIAVLTALALVFLY